MIQHATWASSKRKRAENAQTENGATKKQQPHRPEDRKPLTMRAQSWRSPWPKTRLRRLDRESSKLAVLQILWNARAKVNGVGRT